MKGYIKVYNDCVECKGIGYIEDWYIREAKKKYPDFNNKSTYEKTACIATFPAIHIMETKMQWAARQLSNPNHICGSCSGKGLQMQLIELEKFKESLNEITT